MWNLTDWSAIAIRDKFWFELRSDNREGVSGNVMVSFSVHIHHIYQRPSHLDNSSVCQFLHLRGYIEELTKLTKITMIMDLYKYLNLRMLLFYVIYYSTYTPLIHPQEIDVCPMVHLYT